MTDTLQLILEDHDGTQPGTQTTGRGHRFPPSNTSARHGASGRSPARTPERS